MRKRINLLKYHEKYIKTEKFFLKFKRFIYFSLSFSILITFITLIILNNKKNELNQLIKEKKYLENFISKNKDVDIAYQIFSNKFLQIKNILNSDVNFYPYYKIIIDSLKKATSSASLESITITKNKDTNFTISFKDFNALINFLDFIEDESYLSNFRQLTLKNINLNQTTTSNQAGQEYKLDFVGQFKN